jgi:hypothetical protein
MPAVFAQSEPGFEVASIKPAPDLTELVRSHSTHVGVKIDRALADFGALSLDDLIQYACGIKPFQLPGGGDALAHFDIMAKLPYGATPEEVPANTNPDPPPAASPKGLSRAAPLASFGIPVHRIS